MIKKKKKHLSWLDNLTMDVELYDPHEHGEMALLAFCEKTELSLSFEDLSGHDRSYYKPSSGWRKEDSKVRAGGVVRDFIQECFVFDAFQRFRRRDEQEAEEPRMPASRLVKQQVDHIEALLKSINNIRNHHGDEDLWVFPGVIRPFSDHPFDTEAIDEQNWWNEVGLKGSPYEIMFVHSAEIFQPIAESVLAHKREQLRRIRAARGKGGRDRTKSNRQQLVAELLVVRKGRFRFPTRAGDLWSSAAFTRPGAADTTIHAPVPGQAGQRFIKEALLRKSAGLHVAEAFLAPEDVALLLMAAGIEHLSSEKLATDNLDTLEQAVEDDWKAIRKVLKG